MVRSTRLRLTAGAIIAWSVAVALAAAIAALNILSLRWVAPLVVILAAAMTLTLAAIAVRAIPARLAAFVLGATDEPGGGGLRAVHGER